MIFAVPIACFVLLALWTWVLCQSIIREHSYAWIALVAFVPPIGIPAWLINFCLLGDAFGTMQRRNAATQRIGYLREILRDGDIVSHRLELAEILLERGDFAAALAEIEQILARDSENLQAHLIAARVFVASQKPEQALAHLDFIYSENSAFASYGAALLYATTLAATNRTEKAQPIFQMLLDHHAIPEVLYHYAAFLMQTGEAAQARQLLKALTAEYRSNPAYQPKRDEPWLKRAKQLLSQ